MRTVEQGGGGKRLQLARFAGLGALTGAIAGVLIAIDFNWASLYVLPGLVFGLAFGALLHRQRLLRSGRAALYVAAATLAIAAAVGGGLLAGATVLLLRIARWPLLVVAGALLGALLPILVEGGDVIGTVAFYILWQGGYAAALAASLPRVEAI